MRECIRSVAGRRIAWGHALTAVLVLPLCACASETTDAAEPADGEANGGYSEIKELEFGTFGARQGPSMPSLHVMWIAHKDGETIETVITRTVGRPGHPEDPIFHELGGPDSDPIIYEYLGDYQDLPHLEVAVFNETGDDDWVNHYTIEIHDVNNKAALPGAVGNDKPKGTFRRGLWKVFQDSTDLKRAVAWVYRSSDADIGTVEYWLYWTDKANGWKPITKNHQPSVLRFVPFSRVYAWDPLNHESECHDEFLAQIVRASDSPFHSLAAAQKETDKYRHVMMKKK